MLPEKRFEMHADRFSLRNSKLTVATRLLKIAILAVAVSAINYSVAKTESPTTSGAATAIAKTPAPKIQFAETEFAMGNIIAGTVVRHDFTLTNTGTAPLVIMDVNPSCGCTTIEHWPTRLEPGQTGAIQVRFDSTDFHGEVAKWIGVTSNDPAQPQAVLTLTATISNPIELTPANAIFTPIAGSLARESKTIRITNHTGKPLLLSAPESASRAFVAELKTVLPENEFELDVTTVPPFAAGTTRGIISIKTNSSQMPTLALTALAVVQQPVTVSPAEIRLRDTPLPSNLETRVTLRNYSGMAGFAVSEPTVNVPGATAVVKEVEAGRVFSVLLTFPAGFALPPGEKAEVKIKTTHPEFPLVTVPIRQNP